MFRSSFSGLKYHSLKAIYLLTVKWYRAGTFQNSLHLRVFEHFIYTVFWMFHMLTEDPSKVPAIQMDDKVLNVALHHRH